MEMARGVRHMTGPAWLHKLMELLPKKLKEMDNLFPVWTDFHSLHKMINCESTTDPN